MKMKIKMEHETVIEFCDQLPNFTKFVFFVTTKGCIPLGVEFALRWQSNASESTCNANDSTYIPLRFSIKIRNIQGSVL